MYVVPLSFNESIAHDCCTRTTSAIITSAIIKYSTYYIYESVTINSSLDIIFLRHVELIKMNSLELQSHYNLIIRGLRKFEDSLFYSRIIRS